SSCSSLPGTCASAASSFPSRVPWIPKSYCSSSCSDCRLDWGRMRVLVLHNRYRYRGGEDRVVAAETAMLRDHGVDVVVHEVDNSGGLVQLARGSAWSSDSFQKIERLCRELEPDIAHVHNFWATLSPSIHAACHAACVPTVQTLHNYRLLCVNALFHRDGTVCTDCLGKIPWRGVMHRCYHDSAAASALVGHMIATNRRRDTWSEVDAF